MRYHNFVNFSQWLENELKQRGWTRVEAARRSGISHSMFDKVINGRTEPGPKFLEGIARAFKVSPIVVYRAAGVFPAKSEDDRVVEEIKDLIAELPPEEQENVAEYIRMRRRLLEERQKPKPKTRLNNQTQTAD